MADGLLETIQAVANEISPAHAKVISDVQQHGWHVIGVLPDAGHPAWAYSIGFFHTFKQPEIIVFGLRGETMHQLVNNVGERIRSGFKYQDGTTDAELLQGYSCRFRRVASEWFDATVGFARSFYRGTSFPLLQLFWPDRDGAFPWDSACDPAIRSLQPRLYAFGQEAGAKWLLS